jgi:AcrR family transcriptional regulator
MGIKERRDREKQERRQLILKTAAKVFAASDVKSVTMDKIAECCELSKGSIYLHFSTKSELIAEIVLDFHLELKEEFEIAAKGQKNALTALYKIGEAYRDLQSRKSDVNKLLHLGDSLEFQNQLSTETKVKLQEASIAPFEVMARTIQSGIDAGIFKPDVIAMDLALIIAGSSMGIVQLINCHQECCQLPKTENLIEKTWSLILDGVVTSKEKLDQIENS